MSTLSDVRNAATVELPQEERFYLPKNLKAVA
jgi:hypothetical protein